MTLRLDLRSNPQTNHQTAQGGLRRSDTDLAKATSKITAALREIGVLYRVDGKGRGAKSYLVKAA